MTRVYCFDKCFMTFKEAIESSCAYRKCDFLDFVKTLSEHHEIEIYVIFFVEFNKRNYLCIEILALSLRK